MATYVVVDRDGYLLSARGHIWLDTVETYWGSVLIVVAGTPGTGKSLLGVNLSRMLKRKFTTISWIVLEKGLWLHYDAARRSFVIDDRAVIETLRKYTDYIVETHWLELFESIADSIEGVIVTRCNPVILLERLKRRGWPAHKIAENVEAELTGVIAGEARALAEKGIPVVEIDTTHGRPSSNAALAIDMLRKGESSCCIDWLTILDEKKLEFLLESLARLSSGVNTA